MDKLSTGSITAFCSILVGLFSAWPLFGQNKGNELSISLDKNELVRPCPPGHRHCGTELPSSELVINISANLGSRTRIPFRYKVTGGRIVGKGSKAKWNLSEAHPGTYRIYLQSGTGKNRKTAEEVVTVIDAQCICDPECPVISVDASKERAIPGETLYFEAKVQGGSQDSVSYKWKTPSGIVLEGEDNHRLKVQIPADTKPGTEIKIILTVGGGLEIWGCPTHFEKTVVVESVP